MHFDHKLVTHMMNLMQDVYANSQIRGKGELWYFDGLDKKPKEVAPFFSALVSFIIVTSINLREPGQEKINSDISKRQIKENCDRFLFKLDELLSQPTRSILCSTIDKFIDGLNLKPLDEEHYKKLFKDESIN
jgi:hypothetical protein